MTQTSIETEVEVRFLSFLLQHFHSYNPGYFVFCKHFNVIVMEVLYVHGAEMFAKTKLSGFLMSLSFNKCSISALTAPTFLE